MEYSDLDAGLVGFECDDGALGPATDGAGQVQSRRRLSATGKDELPQRLQVAFGLIDFRFKPPHRVDGQRRQGWRLRGVWRRQVRADDEQFVLYFAQLL